LTEISRPVPAETQAQRTNWPSWLAWTAATTIGYALGMTLSAYLINSLGRALSPFVGGILNVLLYGAAIGISVGICQFVAIPRGLVPLRSWLLASLIGAAIVFAVASLVGEALGNVVNPTTNIVLGEGTIEDTSGAVVGLAIGCAQWLLWRPHLQRAQLWILASIVGPALGYGTAAALLELFDLPVLKAATPFSFGLILGLLAGVFQGLVLRASRRH